MNTKPKQGGPFRKVRSQMMNCKEILPGGGERDATKGLDVQSASGLQLSHPEHSRDVTKVAQMQTQS